MKTKSIHGLTLLFGVFYLFSGIVKIIDIDNFLFLMRLYKFKPFIYLAPSIPVIEIILGILLVTQIRLKQSLAFSTVLLIVFTLIFSFGHFYFKLDDCGCFGGIDFLKMSPTIFYLRNGLLVILSIYLYSSVNKEYKPFSILQISLIILLIIVASVIIGKSADLNQYLKRTPYTRSTIDAYHDNFINKNIQETILGQYVQTSQDSSYLVFIFSFDCPHCVVSSMNLNKYVENNLTDKIIGITNGSRAEERFFNENVPCNFEYKKIKHIKTHEITGFYPLSFYVEQDTIRFKVRGSLPPFEKFKEKYFPEVKGAF